MLKESTDCRPAHGSQHAIALHERVELQRRCCRCERRHAPLGQSVSKRRVSRAEALKHGARGLAASSNCRVCHSANCRTSVLDVTGRLFCHSDSSTLPIAANAWQPSSSPLSHASTRSTDELTPLDR
eukprot:4064682-Pleurochrysis_carterae.AAC.1